MKDQVHGEECVAFAVGGTGGHVLPAVRIANHLPGEGKRILIGVGIEENPYVSRKEFARFNVLGMNFSSGIFSGLFAIGRGVSQALRVLRRERCTHVIGMGGFHSLPVLVAAWFLRVPITLYEPNLVPGRVNKLFSLFSKRTLIMFDEVKKHLYGEFKLLNLTMKKDQYRLPSRDLLRTEFGLDPNRKTVLVFGGSSGAKTINEEVSKVLATFGEQIQVIHLTGKATELKEYYESFGVKAYVATFLKSMQTAWKAADFAICRAGAGTLKEILISKTPALLIPYPYAVSDHQKHNAVFLEKVGGASFIEEKDLDPEFLRKRIEEFLDEKKLDVMQNNLNQYVNTRKGEYVDSLLL